MLRATELQAEPCAAGLRGIELRATEAQFTGLRAATLRAATLRATTLQAVKLRAVKLRAELSDVGLIELTDDGGYQLDSFGNPIETYDTNDIGEFAKCWTGFSLRAGRSNVEASRAAKASGHRVAGAGAKGPSCWLGFAGQCARAFQAGLHGQARLGPRPPQVRWA